MRRGASPILVLTVAVLLGACSDDGGGDDEGAATATTTEPSAATDPVDAPTATAADTTTTSDPAATTTTSPNLPPSDSAVVDLLVPPDTFGAGYAPDDTYGDGTFDGDLCEDVTIDPTWDDQAGQALSAGGASITEAVLRFADEATATAFVQDLTEGITTCDPNKVPEPIGGAGDEASRAGSSDEEGAREQVVVRVGAVVAVATAVTPDGSTPLTDDVAAAMASALTA